jgi:hypothetical protein
MNTITDRINSLPTHEAPDLSDRYMFLDTRKIIDDMKDLGFAVADFKKPATRTPNGAFGIHQVDFRLPKHIGANVVESEVPRILFMNSYDGSLKASFLSGVFRLVCSNGLVMGQNVQKQKILHVGDYQEQLLKEIKAAAQVQHKAFDAIDHYKGIELEKGVYLEFAKDAAKLRYPENTIDITASTLLQPRRREDTAKDLWTTFNVVQENLVKGGIPAVGANGLVKTLNTLNNIQATNKINAQLWDLMEEYATH